MLGIIGSVGNKQNQQNKHTIRVEIYAGAGSILIPGIEIEGIDNGYTLRDYIISYGYKTMRPGTYPWNYEIMSLPAYSIQSRDLRGTSLMIPLSIYAEREYSSSSYRDWSTLKQTIVNIADPSNPYIEIKDVSTLANLRGEVKVTYVE